MTEAEARTAGDEWAKAHVASCQVIKDSKIEFPDSVRVVTVSLLGDFRHVVRCNGCGEAWCADSSEDFAEVFDGDNLAVDNDCPLCGEIVDDDTDGLFCDGREYTCENCGAKLVAVEWEDETLTLIVREDSDDISDEAEGDDAEG